MQERLDSSLVGGFSIFTPFISHFATPILSLSSIPSELVGIYALLGKGIAANGPRGRCHRNCGQQAWYLSCACVFVLFFYIKNISYTCMNNESFLFWERSFVNLSLSFFLSFSLYLYQFYRTICVCMFHALHSALWSLFSVILVYFFSIAAP